MREISLDLSGDVLPCHTFLNYGDTRSGKTVFAATFPRPLVIVDTAERGYESIRTMDPSWWFEPNHKPIIWGVDQMNDMLVMLAKADALIASGAVRTIVIDAFSFYCDFFLNGILSNQDKPDNRAAYGTLGMHLRDLRVKVHTKGTNVVWNCLAKHPEMEDGKMVSGSPLIPGQQGDKFSAGVDFLFYSRLDQLKKAGEITTTFQIRTQKYMNYIAGHRLGTRAVNLPDPFVGTYADLMTTLGYDVEAMRAALAKKPGAAPVKAAVQAVGPAIKSIAPRVISPSGAATNNKAT